MAERAPARARRVRRPREWPWLVGASLLIAAGLAMAHGANSVTRGQQSGRLNLNTVTDAGELLPVLQMIPDRAARERAAGELFAAIDRARPLRNVGALAGAARAAGVPLTRLKPLVVVRTQEEFQELFLRWTGIYFGGFYLVALLWAVTRFSGDRAFLPALHLLTGIGLVLMVSLRDPLRDTLEFRKFALGVFLGCLLLLLPLFRLFDYRRLAAWCYTPLFGALALFGLLLARGTGPGGSDIKVNLGPFQPVEAIKILLVLFLAGYFTRHWERLRDLREKRFFGGLFGRLGMPRVAHVGPVLCAVGAALVLFFALKDLGPALVVLFVFLAMFAVARGRPALAAAGLAILVSVVAAGYRMGTPRTVVERIQMWLEPWDNDVRGGNQLAHALWAFSTGGLTGTGPGWGDPAMIPAGNTDLVLPAIGEEWGLAGVTAVFLLSCFLVARALRVAARASSTYGFFLALGLGCLIAVEMLLISAGSLGALPLSGVASPFLSSGNTAMLANFLAAALLLSVSARGDPPEPRDLLAAPARRLGQALGVAAVALLALAARYQAVEDARFLARDARTIEEDGVKRALHNPRLNSLAREIPRGHIFDRRGVPLATSDWSLLEGHRAIYQQLGVPLDEACSRFERRHYPFGAATAHVTGDLRTGENFHATNASLVEHDANNRLQGFEFTELAGLVRHRHRPRNPALAAVLARPRDVRLTLDIRLQLRAREILSRHLRALRVTQGALVAMDAATGDVLALVSEPSPDPPGRRNRPPTPDELLDRARYGQYPPGSTFKLVTAIAALRADAGLSRRVYFCRPLAGGRVGANIRGWNRPIYDDIGDHAHGPVRMEQAIVVSCNAYFAQLGVHDVGSKALAETAALIGIPAGDPPELRRALPFAAYGQGPVLVTPFKMARVAAAIAAGGNLPQGRWILDEANPRTDPPRRLLPEAQAAMLAAAMRRVVTEGTARRAMAGTTASVAGKTGTAQLDRGQPHAWFAGFAPYDGPRSRRLAFAVVVEHGGYGGRAAAPIARELVEAARELGLLN